MCIVCRVSLCNVSTATYVDLETNLLQISNAVYVFVISFVENTMSSDLRLSTNFKKHIILLF